MADCVNLFRFALAIAGRAELLPVTGSRNAVAGVPEVGGSRLVSGAGKHAALLAAFDLPERIAAELKIVALLVDRETAVTFDEKAIVDAGDQVVGSDGRRTRREPHVRHALERNAGPGIGIATAARFGLADQMGLIADGLIVLE